MLSLFDANTVSRFWKHVDKSGDCWLWTASRDRREGYGWFALGPTKRCRAHRVSMVIETGKDIPAGLCVLHHCDTPPCVRPDHLYLGTQAQNLADMAARGRSTRGVANPGAKLTDDLVRQIRKRYAAGDRHLGQEYGVSNATIQRVATMRLWTHVQ